MINKCTTKVLEEVKELILNDMVTKVQIQEAEGDYYVEVIKSENLVGSALDFRVVNANIIQEFAEMLASDRVSKFSYSYLPKEYKYVESRAYKAATEQDTFLKQLHDHIAQASMLISFLSLGDKSFENISTKQMVGNKPKYYKATAKELIEALSEGLK